MTDEDIKPNDSAEAAEKIPPINAYGASIYLIVVGTVYLMGFWGRTGINAFEFISFTDVLKYTIKPLASVFIVGIIAAIYSTWMFDFDIKIKTVPKWVEKAKAIFSKCYKHLIVYGIFAAIQFGGEQKWLYAGFLAAFPAGSALYNVGLLRQQVSESVRLPLITVLCMVLLSSYGAGNVDSYKIYSGENYISVKLSNEASNSQTVNARYLGLLGERIFLYHPESGEVEALLSSEAKNLVLIESSGDNTIKHSDVTKVSPASSL